MKVVLNVLKKVLPFAVAVTGMAALLYVSLHYSLRQTANDPQIQLANDWADTILTGNEPSRVPLGVFIDPARSLAPFGIIYDRDGNIVASSVAAPSTMSQPEGVFASVEAAPHNEVRFTWQPANGERYATVIKKTTFQDETFYVLAGRNIEEVEDRIVAIAWIVGVGWLLTIGAVIVAQHTHLAAAALRRIRRDRQ